MGLAIGHKCHEDLSLLGLFEDILDCLTPKVKGLWSFTVSRIAHLMTQCHMSEVLKSVAQCCENLKSWASTLFLVVMFSSFMSGLSSDDK
jgi:hypothetical protein